MAIRVTVVTDAGSADTRVVPVFEGESLQGELQALVDSGEVKASPKKTAVFHRDGERVILTGAGKREDADAERLRVAAAAAASRAKEIGATALTWDVPDIAGATSGVVEGTLLALYSFDMFKSKKDDNGLEELELVGGSEDEARTAQIEAEAQNAARDLQNLPANVATPQFLAKRARKLEGVDVEVLGREEIESRGMGALAAVAQGSYAEPQLIVMRYDGGGGGPHLGFVGKAVTFDSGGISIKPAAKMHEMKFDMSGGAAVIEAMGAIARLRLPAKVIGVVGATENMPSGRSMRPGDIVTAMNGVTIEVNNTDAEGRLVLADALTYAVEQGAERLVDLATLTGAILVALGHTYAGYFSNDDAWVATVDAAGDAAGELGWRLPLHPEYEESTKGRYADLQNVSEARDAGSIYGAEFLKRFVDARPWVHIDIAGTAWGMKRNYVGNGASGFGVRTLIELARAAR
ncbi:MAG TPA: leucyl aminopeptidase [Thermoleophilaceae bacterium]|nr:leucyl aminopeptidase [Thermoleophilaceae bacterium]